MHARKIMQLELKRRHAAAHLRNATAAEQAHREQLRRLQRLLAMGLAVLAANALLVILVA